MHDDQPYNSTSELPAGNACAVDESYYSHTFAPTFRELRREESADDFDDITRPTVLKSADWPAIYKLCQTALDNPHKDLRIACHFVEAGLRVHGWTGLRDGLKLLTSLVNDFWDELLPSAYDNYQETRATPITNLLDDPDRGVCFPSTLRALPLIGTDNPLSYNTLARLKRSLANDDQEELARFRSSLPPEYFRHLEQTISECNDHLNALYDSLQQRMEHEAPALLNVRTALDDFHTLIASELSLLGVEGVQDIDDSNPTTSDLPTMGLPELQRLDREGLYYLLDQASDRLRSMEPHSPIPYLVKRAVRLGRLPFPALMKHVIREESILSELNREFGIADSDGIDP